MRKIIYPGTFDPIHKGHLDIAIRTAELFDELEFVVAINSKKEPLFSIEKRVEMIKDSVNGIKNIKVSSFDGLVVDHAKKINACSIIRGMRHVSDFEFEFQMAMMNFHLNPEITSLFMMPNEKYIHLNSSVIKEVVENGGDASPFVTNSVNDALLSKFFS